MGLFENRLNPYTQWLMIIIPMKNGYFIGGLDPIFRHTHIDTSRSEPLTDPSQALDFRRFKLFYHGNTTGCNQQESPHRMSKLMKGVGLKHWTII